MRTTLVAIAILLGTLGSSACDPFVPMTVPDEFPDAGTDTEAPCTVWGAYTTINDAGIVEGFRVCMSREPVCHDPPWPCK